MITAHIGHMKGKIDHVTLGTSKIELIRAKSELTEIKRQQWSIAEEKRT